MQRDTTYTDLDGEVIAWLADRASLILANSGAVRGLNIFAACIMIAVGSALLIKTQEWW